MDSGVEIARGWDLFRLGAFAEAESLFGAHTTDPDALHLLLWIALRRGDAAAKRRYGELLGECGGPKLAGVGRAHENVALATLELPMKPWIEPTAKWARAEVAYARALIAFISHSPYKVREQLAQALPQTAEQRVRYAQLRAWIAGLEDQFERLAMHLMHALNLALQEKVDCGLVARIAESLAPLVRELDLGEIGDHAERLLEAVVWPKDASTYRFYTQRALAWRKTLRGDWIEALHLLDATLSIAPDAVRRALIFADRSRISRAAGEPLSAASSRSNAFACFSEIDWTRAGKDEATIVFGAMDVLREERDRASALFERAAGATISKMAGMAHGGRFAAFKAFAQSHITDGEEAIGHAHDAYIAFKEIKYVHRATNCALRAVELHGGARWRSRAERLVAAYPRSLAAREYERLTSPLTRVQGRRREVAELLVSTNLTAREIGERLGMAEGTVRVHIKRINKLLSVGSRSQLVRLLLGTQPAA